LACRAGDTPATAENTIAGRETDNGEKIPAGLPPNTREGVG